MIPPEEDAEFVASMEDVLETYALGYDPSYPVLCMDEQPVQLIKESRPSIPASIRHARRVDYEYERAGTASIFMFTEPLASMREVHVRPRRTKVDWALEMKEILETHYADVQKIRLVCDNLNTHTKGAFYEAFDPEKARELCAKIDFCYTPKHGSWLNVAENELSALTGQCLGRRYFEKIEEMREEITEWARERNEKQRGVNWQFKLKNARTKLKSLYPQIQS